MSTRPLLLIDVDGPLNPYGAPPHRRPEGYSTHRLNPLTSDGVRWQIRHRKPLRVWLNAAHGPQLTALPFELTWATTWTHEANGMIGPLIGLPELPVIEWPEGAAQPRKSTVAGTYWKTRHIVDWAAGRPFAWIDDDIDSLDEDYVEAHHPGPALLHWVDPRKGLLPSDFEVLAAWAEGVAVSG